MHSGNNWVSTDYYCGQAQMFKWEVKKDTKKRLATISWTLGTDVSSNDTTRATYYLCNGTQQLKIRGGTKDINIEVGESSGKIRYGFADRGSWLDKHYNPNGTFEDFNGDFVGIHRWVGVRGWVWKKGTFDVEYNSKGDANFSVSGSFAWYGKRLTFSKTFQIPSISPSTLKITYSPNKPNKKLSVSNMPTKLTQTKTWGKDYTLSKKVPTIKGYEFQYWKKGKKGTKHFAPGSTYKTNENATFYAVWEKDPKRKITFNLAGGMYGGVSDVRGIHESTDGGKTYHTVSKSSLNTFEVSTNCILKIAVPTKSGYSFSSWVSNKSGKHYVVDKDGWCYIKINNSTESTNFTLTANYDKICNLNLVMIQDINSKGEITFGRDKYRKTSDTKINTGKKYYTAVKTESINIYTEANPYELGWYEYYDEYEYDVDEDYDITGDTVIDSTKVYYKHVYNNTSKKYEFIQITPTDSDVILYESYYREAYSPLDFTQYYYYEDGIKVNPKAEGWFEPRVEGEPGEYTASEDEVQNLKKSYYIKLSDTDVTTYKPVDAEGLYELQYKPTEDDRFYSNKRYYTVATTPSTTYTEVSPNSQGWKSWNRNIQFIKVSDWSIDGYDVAHKFYDFNYYKKDSITNNYIKISPSSEGWFEKVDGLFTVCTALTFSEQQYFIHDEQGTYISASPKLLQWFEKNTDNELELTKDDYINSTKSYYSYEEELDEWVVVSPSDELFVKLNDGSYYKSSDTYIIPGQTYYQQIEYLEVTPESANLYIEDVKNEYGTSWDASIIEGKSYFTKIPNVVPITPKSERLSEVWYQSEYVKSKHTEIKQGVTYYYKKGSTFKGKTTYHYAKVGLNPKKRGWYTFVKKSGKYVKSAHTKVKKDVNYYQKESFKNSKGKTVTKYVKVTPKVKGWFEYLSGFNLKLSSDLSFMGKIYVIHDSARGIVPVNPKAEGWFEVNKYSVLEPSQRLTLGTSKSLRFFRVTETEVNPSDNPVTIYEKYVGVDYLRTEKALKGKPITGNYVYDQFVPMGCKVIGWSTTKFNKVFLSRKEAEKYIYLNNQTYTASDSKNFDYNNDIILYPIVLASSSYVFRSGRWVPVEKIFVWQDEVTKNGNNWIEATPIPYGTSSWPRSIFINSITVKNPLYY